jgi:RimJ/RimL family protein N-acetyltransferase/ribosomal protein S18 acetylase RimI-like enzyme
MSEERDALIRLLQPEVRDGILYKSFCVECNVRDITADELWDMFDVRWAALSEARLDKGLETFLMRDSIDNEPSTIQIAALDPAGHAIGGLRIHIAPLALLGGFDAVQISRVGVAWVAQGAGIGSTLVSKALHMARALGMVKSLSLAFLLSRVLDTASPNRVLRFYERIGFRRTNLYTVTKGLSNCLMLAGVKQSPLQYLRSQGFQVEEARERGAIYPTLLIASFMARQIQTARRSEVEDHEAQEPPGPVLQGRNVRVRPFVYADLPVRHRWEHHGEPPGYATVARAKAPTMAELQADFNQELKAAQCKRFAIETSEGRLIGQVSYFDLQHDTRSVFIDVMIGEPDCWEGEWGREAIRLLLEHLFGELGIHRVSILVSQTQHLVQRDLESLGFRQDGILRHNEIVNGHYIDHCLLSILEDECRQR